MIFVSSNMNAKFILQTFFFWKNFDQKKKKKRTQTHTGTWDTSGQFFFGILHFAGVFVVVVVVDCWLFLCVVIVVKTNVSHQSS